jgi:serine/threonine-protein kinase
VSPEQARCQAVDARADLYAVGLLIYALLVGHGPFAHVKDALDLLDAHIREVPAPPSRYAAQAIPAELDRAVLKALAKRPEHRFQSAALFAEALERIAASLEAAATGPLPAAAGRFQASVEVTAQGTLLLPAAAPSSSVGGSAGGDGVASQPELAAWFASLPATTGATPVAAASADLAGVRGNAVVFVLVTLASTVVFSLLAAVWLLGVGR